MNTTWSDIEIRILVAALADGRNHSEVSKELVSSGFNRSTGAVKHAIRRLPGRGTKTLGRPRIQVEAGIINAATDEEKNREQDIKFQKAMAFAHPELAGLCETPSTKAPKTMSAAVPMGGSPAGWEA